MKLFLIDAYALIYRSYYAFIKNPRINSKGLNTSAIYGFVNTLEDVLKRENPTHIAVGFDPPGPTFRHEAFEAYKAKREETPEDIRIATPYIRKIIEAYRIPMLEVPRYEADDVIGAIAQQAEKEGFEVYMMTPDKDYGQLVSEHIFQYRPKFGGDYEVLGVPEVLAKYELKTVSQMTDLLGLMGDSSDNIPGCPGVGEKTAQKLLKEYESIEDLIQHSGQLTGSLKTKIEENSELIRFSKFLATIATDAPIRFNASDCVRKEPDKARLIELYTELEFRTFIQKMSGENEVKNIVPRATLTSLFSDEFEKPKPVQRSLFDDEFERPKPVQQSLFDDFFAAEKNPIRHAELDSASLANNEIAGRARNDAAVLHSDLRSFYDNDSIPIENQFYADITNTPHTYYLVDTEEKRQELGALLCSCDSFAFDTETDGINPLTVRLVGISFAVKEFEAWYVPVPESIEKALPVLAPFTEALQNEKTIKIGQNIKFDMLVLRKYRIRVAGPLFDTMIAHYLLNPDLRHGMDYMAETCLQYKPIPIDSLIVTKGKYQTTMRSVPVEQVCEYAAEDADVTLRLKNYLAPKLVSEDLNSLFYDIEMPLVHVLAEMEYTGVKLDLEALKQSSEVLTKNILGLMDEIYQLAGTEFNINSAKQVGEILFDRLKIGDSKLKKTKTGSYSTSEDILEKIRNKHPIVEKLLDYRGLKKLLSTYIDALPELVERSTGKIHTSFNQTVTSTGRLSSTNPNLQNIPIRDAIGREIRKAFIADNADCVFFSADYSQIELRIMAHLSNDANMIKAFSEGADIHAATAAKIFGIPLEKVTSDMRRKAKTANFGIIYGISAFGLSERLNISRAESNVLINGYFNSYPQVKEYMDRSIQTAKEKGYVETIYKRKRSLADINSHNSVVRGYAERFAINAPIQGSAADIIKVAMVRIFNRFENEKLRSRMILQVHDELNFNVYKDELEQVKQIVTEEMEGAATLKVPLIVDYGVGDNWLEAH